MKRKFLLWFGSEVLKINPSLFSIKNWELCEQYEWLTYILRYRVLINFEVGDKFRPIGAFYYLHQRKIWCTENSNVELSDHPIVKDDPTFKKFFKEDLTVEKRILKSNGIKYPVFKKTPAVIYSGFKARFIIYMIKNHKIFVLKNVEN